MGKNDVLEFKHIPLRNVSGPNRYGYRSVTFDEPSTYPRNGSVRTTVIVDVPESAFGPADKHGFVIRSEDAADFLDEKLEILGLNDKERNEFIIYWLPRLEQSNYVYIRFLTKDEIDAYQKLNVEPSPDTVIRVMMSYKGLDEPIYVKEQPLDPAERAGFTVVEWGGIEMK